MGRPRLCSRGDSRGAHLRDVAGVVAPKSRKGIRTVPLFAVLRDQLLERKMQVQPQPTDWVFTAPRRGPITPSQVRRAAAKAWANENKKRG